MFLFHLDGAPLDGPSVLEYNNTATDSRNHQERSLSDEENRPRRVVKTTVIDPPKVKAWHLPRHDIKNWRQQLAQLLLETNTNPWEVICRIARGEAVVPVLPDGREGPPVVPSTADSLRAAMELKNSLYGTPVPQTEIVKAQQASEELLELQALSYEEVKRLAARILTEDVKANAEEVANAEDPPSEH